MKILLALLFLNITLSCATKNIRYNHINILEKYSSNYIIYVDDKKIDFENVYLDKDNIEYVKIDKQNKMRKENKPYHRELFYPNCE